MIIFSAVDPQTRSSWPRWPLFRAVQRERGGVIAGERARLAPDIPGQHYWRRCSLGAAGGCSRGMMAIYCFTPDQVAIL
jgi:hypothetical protein